MALAHVLREYVDACFSGVWIESDEQREAILEVTQLCREETWRLAVWDLYRGVQFPLEPATETSTTDPLAAVGLAQDLAEPVQTSLVVLVNFHHFLGSAEIIQALAHHVEQGKQQRSFVVILSPQAELPRELEKLFVVLRHELPSREQLAVIAHELASGEELPTGEQFNAVLDAAAGLTDPAYEARMCGRNCVAWARQGLIDDYFLATYAEGIDEMPKVVKRARRMAGPQVVLLSALSPFNRFLTTNDQMVAATKAQLAAGADGVWIYRSDFLDELKLWDGASAAAKLVAR